MNKEREQELLIKLGDHLRELRLKKGYTLQQLAYEAEIELSQVHRIEKGKINPKYTTLQVISVALDINISELLKGL
jgi:transcriptional regulator with XRE-family HTH domain